MITTKYFDRKIIEYAMRIIYRNMNNYKFNLKRLKL